MEKVKILFLTRYGEGLVGAPHAYHEFEQEVGKIAECQWAGEGWSLHRRGESMEEAVNRVMPDCDWVIDNKNTFKQTPKNRHYRVGVFLSDLHAKYTHNIDNPAGFCNLINSCNYDAVFMKYLQIYGTGYDPKIFLDRLQPEIYYLPWSVDTDKFRREKKKIDLTFIGMTSSYLYPLRQSMYDNVLYLGRGRRIVRCLSPRGKTFERKVSELIKDYHVGEKYCDLLNKTRIMLFGSSRYRYAVQKYFEAAASGCLILADEPSNAKDLGFIHGRTYIDVNEHEWEDAATWCLENWSQVQQISTYAVKNVVKHHTHKIRAKEFVEMLR